jgi:NADPH-dependent 2,4-dienoyl-CoA reductase/sulfur reductase-like enzyme
MKEVRILGVMINDPAKGAEKIQGILTKYGCTIRTRLGLHDIDENYAIDTGLMLLELRGEMQEYLRLENELLALDGVEVQKMVFRK